MTSEHGLLVVGGGIGGMAAALALARSGQPVRVIERASALTEVGAGVQLGPNVTRLLQAWGLGPALDAVACRPQQLQARDAASGRVLATRALGEAVLAQYGAPYVGIHRADLLDLLARAVQAAGVPVQLGAALDSARDAGDAVHWQAGAAAGQAALLVGADGLWSRSRALLGLHDAPRFAGHLAWRATVPADVAQACLPGALQQVTVWMGPRLHVVHYPVRGARLLNVVAIMAGPMPADPQDWDGQAQAPALLRERLDPGLRALLDGAPAWRLWALHDRTPLQSAAQMARGRVALLGDAAHPMRPYLAQGAGMAIEDAQALAQALQRHGSTPTALSAYAQARWARNARVQARALRQGQIYHAQGPVAWARNSAMRLAGARLMDLRWLYAGGPSV